MKANIEKLDNLGNGICYVNDKITFVPYTMPGDEIELHIEKEKKNIQFGICDKVISSSLDRVEARCPYYGICGGCSLQHMKYSDTILFKKQRVIDAFKKNDLPLFDFDIVESNPNYNYRNKITLKVIDGNFGYYEPKSHKLIKINECMLVSDAINDILKIIKFKSNDNGEFVVRTNHNGEILISLNGDLNVNIDELKSLPKLMGIVLNRKTIYGDDHLITMINNYAFKYSYDSFFQVNNDICSKLLDFIKSEAREKTVLDLYCGVGSLSMAASNNNTVYGIEIVPNAIKNAAFNQKINKKDNMYFMLGDVKDTISKINAKFDLIIVDPPRKGLDAKTIEFLNKSDAEEIIYIACSLDSLVRDLKLLRANYDIKNIKAYDMFPYTYHCETICVLERR